MGMDMKLELLLDFVELMLLIYNLNTWIASINRKVGWPS